MTKKLTERQKRFADEYIRTGNVTRSAVDAGYSVKTATSIGAENLSKPHIKSYIDKRMAENDLDKILSQKEALELLREMAFGEITDKQPMFIGNGVQEMVDVPTPPNVRLRAIESMLKRYDVAGRDGLLNRKLELEIEKLEKELQTETSTEDKLDELIKQNREVLGHDD